jgi:DNA polymerase III delta prime subunit
LNLLRMARQLTNCSIWNRRLEVDPMTDNSKLLSELLRPQQLSDLTLPQSDVERLKQMVHSGTIMNMIFYGRPGLGKTSAARAIIAELVTKADADVYELNGSSGNGAAEVRKIQDYARGGSLNNGVKICFIDEADFLSLQAQASLRYIIEKSSKRCRFLFTANDANRFSEAICSRMRKICFDISPSDRAEVMERLIGRYQEMLPTLGIKYDEKRLREIVGIYFPDLRAIANEFEYEFATGGVPLAA